MNMSILYGTKEITHANTRPRLLSISFDKTRSACCDSNHISHAGLPLLCDRKVRIDQNLCPPIWRCAYHIVHMLYIF